MNEPTTSAFSWFEYAIYRQDQLIYESGKLACETGVNVVPIEHPHMLEPGDVIALKDESGEVHYLPAIQTMNPNN